MEVCSRSGSCSGDAHELTRRLPPAWHVREKPRGLRQFLQIMNPTKPPRRKTTALALPILAAVSLALVLGAITASATAPGTRYSGRATGVSVHTALLDTSLADTGDLPPEGGAQDGTLVQVDTSLAKADVLLSV